MLPENSGNTRDGTSQSDKRLVTFVDQITPGNDFDSVYYRTSGGLRRQHKSCREEPDSILPLHCPHLRFYVALQCRVRSAGYADNAINQ